jgi:hypothetical protein
VVFSGIEQEFGSFPSNPAVTANLSAAIARRSPHLPDCMCHGIFLPCGRFYIDAGGHPEFCSIESNHPDDVMRSLLKGQQLLTEAAREAGVEISTANVDYCGSTWGQHACFSCTMDRETLYRQLAPFLASLVVFGAGGLSPHHPGVVFALSPRSIGYIEKTVSCATMEHRGMCHLRDEPLARSYWRAHITSGEITRCHQCTWLRIATTALVITAIEAGARPASQVVFPSPVEALKKFSIDPEMVAPVTGRGGARFTSIDVQRKYLEAVRDYLGTSVMPNWAEPACQKWENTLHQLEVASEGVWHIDWCIKFRLFRDYAFQFHGLDPQAIYELNQIADDPIRSVTERKKLRPLFRLRDELIETDLKFGALQPAGIFEQMDKAGLIEHKIEGVSDPLDFNRFPTSGRAGARAEQIVRLNGKTGAWCDWDVLCDNTGKTLSLPDPESTTGNWEGQCPRDALSVMLMRRRRPF